MTGNPPTTAPQAEGHSPDRERPLGAYTVLTGAFAAGCGAFAAWMQRSGRRLPEHCMGIWVAAGFIGGIAVTPRPTRWVTSLLTVLTGADALQIAYSKDESSL